MQRQKVSGMLFLATVLIGIYIMYCFKRIFKPLCICLVQQKIFCRIKDYGRIISFGVLFSAIDSSMAGIIRADGNPNNSMAGLLIGCITNIILDPIFIFVFHWGVKGAAWGNYFRQIFNALYILLTQENLKA